MPIELNHTVVAARDAEASARWLADLFGIARAEQVGHFWQVGTANGVDLEFDTFDGSFTTQHYAFLVTEEEFDLIYLRIVEQGVDDWADAGRQRAGRINTDGSHRDLRAVASARLRGTEHWGQKECACTRRSSSAPTGRRPLTKPSSTARSWLAGSRRTSIS